MATVLRLTRRGAKKRPYYRIVVADSRFPRDGRFLEILGTYHPIEQPDKQIVVKQDRVKYWLSKGAKPSVTVRSLIKKHLAAPAAARPATAPAPVVTPPAPPAPAVDEVEKPAE